MEGWRNKQRDERLEEGRGERWRDGEVKRSI